MERLALSKFLARGVPAWSVVYPLGLVRISHLAANVFSPDIPPVYGTHKSACRRRHEDDRWSRTQLESVVSTYTWHKRYHIEPP